MASEFPHEIFIHGPRDLGQSVFHHEPHGGYVANVKYIRADIAEQREAELVGALESIFMQFNPEHLDHVSRTTVGTDARAILAKHKAEGRKNDNDER